MIDVDDTLLFNDDIIVCNGICTNDCHNVGHCLINSSVSYAILHMFETSV